MPLFDYKAYDSAGKPVSGQLEAPTRETARRLLTDQGRFPVDLVAAGTGGGGGGANGSAKAGVAGRSSGLFSGQPTAAEITLFTRELALLLAAGQQLTGALVLIEDDSSTRRVQRLAGRLRGSIAQGRSLEEALAGEGDTFPPVYIGMVKAAEASGQLESVLERVADTREREQKLVAKITSALLYPSLLLITAIAAVLLLMILVVPRFKEMLAGQTDHMPASAALVLGASDWLTQNYEALGLGLIATLIAAMLMMRSPRVKSFTERLLFAMPLVGHLLRMALTVRFCRTLGVLLVAGLGLPAAVSLTRDMIGNENARRLIDRIGTALREGRDFTEPMSLTGVFPSMVTSLLKIGAESGALSVTALRLADMYESKLETALQRLVAVLEPAIIMLVSVFIGSVVLSIVGAILSVYDLAGA